MEGSKNFDAVRRYAMGKMSADEQVLFDQKLREDESLANELAVFKAAQTAMGQFSEAKNRAAAIRDQLKKEGFFEKNHAAARAEIAAETAAGKTGQVVEMPRGRVVGIGSRRNWLAIAAALSVLAVAVPFFLKKPAQPGFDLLSEAKRGILMEKQGLSGYSERDTARMVDSLFLIGQPDEALKLIGQVAKKDKEMQLREGKAFLMKRQFGPAIERFERLIGDGNTLFKTRQAAQYFAAIAYSEKKQLDRSEALFQSLATVRDFDGNLGEFAAEAQKQLSKFR